MLIVLCLGSPGPLVGTDSSLHIACYVTFYYAFQRSIETWEMLELVLFQSADVSCMTMNAMMTVHAV